MLRAAGAGRPRIIAVCVDKRDAADRIVELVKSEFPLAELYVRSFDRGHTLALVARRRRLRDPRDLRIGDGVRRGGAARRSAFSAEEAAETAGDVRERDRERLQVQQVEGIYAGRELFPRRRRRR